MFGLKSLLLTVTVYVPAGRSWLIFPNNFRKFGRPAVRIHTMKCSTEEIKNKILTVCDIKPLLSSWTGSILVLVLNIRLPGNVAVVDWNGRTIRCLDAVGVAKHTLGNQTTGPRGSVGISHDWDAGVNIVDASPNIRVPDDWIAGVLHVINSSFLSQQLLCVLGLDVTPVILIKVVELVINVDWSCNFFFNYQIELASF